MPDPCPAAPRRLAWWVLAGAVLLPCLYLPTLATRFDFIDDGSLVYPTGPMPWPDRMNHLWGRIEDNYRHLGPFRPFLHAYWEIEVETLGADALRWRITRLVWSMAAAGALLWLLRELGIRPLAALAATALAMCNPYRNEIWTSLTLAEGVAMPFALTALTCAAKAPGSRRPWLWDAAGILCVLAALGCKNTFAVLVPAQLVLRVLPNGVGWREGLRLYGRRACVLLLPLAMPVVHYAWYKLNWHPGQYATTPPTLGFVGTFLKGIVGAISIDFIGAGLALALLAVVVARWRGVSLTSPTRQPGQTSSWRRPVLAGLVLLVLGIGVYLPIGAVSGRYAMPAVWGVDLLIAVLLSELASAPAVWLRRAAWAAVGCGLIAVAAANVGRQEKFARRADLLWQTLEHVEQTAPPGACVAWQSGPALNIEEGIHFAWHLHARGRTDIQVRLLTEDGQEATRCEVPGCGQEPDYLITGLPSGTDGGWRMAHEFAAPYWAGKRRYQCYLWEKTPSPALNASVGDPGW